MNTLEESASRLWRHNKDQSTNRLSVSRQVPCTKMPTSVLIVITESPWPTVLRSSCTNLVLNRTLLILAPRLHFTIVSTFFSNQAHEGKIYSSSARHLRGRFRQIAAVSHNAEGLTFQIKAREESAREKRLRSHTYNEVNYVTCFTLFYFN